jgi:hypothetical protein
MVTIKWWVIVLVGVILVLLAFAAGFLYHFYISPLGCSLCLCDKKTVVAVTTQNYNSIWIPFTAVSFAIAAVCVWVGISLHKIAIYICGNKQ